jgi:hypothetical protein
MADLEARLNKLGRPTIETTFLTGDATVRL